MDSEIEQLVRDLVGDRDFVLYTKSVWLEVAPSSVALPPHGWKLHVSSRPSTFAALVSKLVPVLLDERCLFKLAKSQHTLAELNDGRTSPATVGKAFTIYPEPDRLRTLAFRLVDLLRGEVGPRILSDRRVDESAPLYYRYGPFASGWSVDRQGRIVLSLRGPDDAEFDGAATTEYRQPPWATDPFEGERRSDEPDADLLLGDRYTVTTGVYESVRGNVYRAYDEQTGETVVVKQARALVAESNDQSDTRMRIRNERRVLRASEGIVGVPRFIDHFRHLDDEFLVTSDQGGLDLRIDIEENGPYPLGGPGRRSLRRLAAALARILSSLHARGIVMRDLSPKNVVIDWERAEPFSIVDFGLASYDGVQLPGATRGYAPERQWRHDSALDTDDIYALGMTLIEAMTGLAPVGFGDYEHTRTRALENVRERHGPTPQGLVAAVVDLVSDDAELARRACRKLCGEPVTHRLRTSLPTRPAVTTALVADLVTYALDDLLELVDHLLDSSHTPFRKDASLYSGAAGIGIELLHHTAHPGVPERLDRLIARTREVAEGRQLDPGLLLGSTGIDVFLHKAQEYTSGYQRSFPDAAWKPDGHDLLNGAAGAGIGHLWLYEQTADPRDRAIVRRCAEALAGFETEDGFLAHGMAGVLEFQLRVAEPSQLPEVEKVAHAVAVQTETVIARATEMRGTPLRTVSWCNGLAGTARVLLHAGQRLDRTDFVELAMTAANVCFLWVPRLVSTSQCCGASGIGDLLIDLSKLPGAERYWDRALEVAGQLLSRSGGPHSRPVLVEPKPEAGAATWANGLPGVLGFLRRLRDRGGPRIFPGL